MARGFQDDPDLSPVETGARLAIRSGHAAHSEWVNIATAFVIWWRSGSGSRIIWRVRPETSKYLHGVGMHFIPETPPASWSGDCVVIESSDKRFPLYDDVFSMAAYRVRPKTRDENRYYFVLLTLGGAAWVTSIRADIGRTDNEKEIGDIPFLWLGDPRSDDEVKRRTIEAARFCFAFSYYAMSPERVEIRDQGGPMLRELNGKPVKRHGRPVYQWRYLDLSAIRRRDNQEIRGPLDKDGLELSPVLVSPYIRRQGEKVIIVDEHHSHRWKRQDEILGEKKKI